MDTEPEDPTPTQEEQSTPQPQEPPQPAREEPNDEGKGSKKAVLADLAGERDKRQALETKLAELTTAHETKLTEVTNTYETQLTEVNRELAVYRNAAGANASALLDSRAFTEALAKIDPSDEKAVTALITETVAANPLFAATPPQPAGVRDASAGKTPEPTEPTDWLRAAAQKI